MAHCGACNTHCATPPYNNATAMGCIVVSHLEGKGGCTSNTFLKKSLTFCHWSIQFRKLEKKKYRNQNWKKKYRNQTIGEGCEQFEILLGCKLRATELKLLRLQGWKHLKSCGSRIASHCWGLLGRKAWTCVSSISCSITLINLFHSPLNQSTLGRKPATLYLLRFLCWRFQAWSRLPYSLSSSVGRGGQCVKYGQCCNVLCKWHFRDQGHSEWWWQRLLACCPEWLQQQVGGASHTAHCRACPT